METALVIVALIAYVAFRQWLQHHRRIMLHRERMAAIEKGVEVPPLEQEAHRHSWNVQRILLLAGAIWVAIGVGAFATLVAVISSGNTWILPGTQYLSLIPIGIGIAHLITYWAGARRETPAS